MPVRVGPEVLIILIGMYLIFDDFRANVMSAAAERPSYIRFGQAVFNYIDEVYGVARDVQFIDGIDCFYNDNDADAFMVAAWRRITTDDKEK